MNQQFSPNLVRPNLPLRKPSSSPMGSGTLAPVSGQSTPLRVSPVHSTLARNGQGSRHSSTNRDGVAASLAHTPPERSVCSVCGQQGHFCCTQCKKAIYCSVACQAKDWNAHGRACKVFDTELAKEKTMESCVSPLMEDKTGNLANGNTLNIQKVYIKDLASKVIKRTDIQATVVEFCSPGRFFIIAQIPEILEALQTISTELQETCSVPSMSTHTPLVDEVCAVQYSRDLNWYRGLVQNVAADQNTANILYIDFGNEEKVPFKRMRPLTAKLQQFGPCAMECCIAGVVPAAGKWSGNCCITVRQLFEGKMVTVWVLETLENGRVNAVDIELSQGNTLSSFLLKHGYAEKETVDTPAEQHRADAILSASLENFRSHSNGKDDNSWAQAPEPLSLAVGDSFPVVVTHFQSPDTFVVQKVDSAGVIQDLQRKVREHCSQLSVSTNFRPAPGTVCCALFSEDKQWYRAKVLAYTSEERVCVSYLDFGNSENVDLNSLSPISLSLLAVPVQAMTCGLAGVQPVGDSWSQDCISALLRGLSNRILRVEIKGAQEGKALVTIIDDASDPQGNIAELLISAGFGSPAVANISKETEKSPPASAAAVQEPLLWTYPELSCEGHTVALQTCCVESPGKFFCHIDKPTDIQRLKELGAELKLHCEGETSPFEPKLGEPCCAIFPENETWNRAIVKEMYEDMALVSFVDCGYTVKLKKTHLRSIIPRFLSLPFQAIPCWLAGVEPPGSEWSSEALLWFQKLVEGEQLSVRVVSLTEQGYGVELESRGQDVATALVSEQLAIFSGETVEGTQGVRSSNNKRNENMGNMQEQPINSAVPDPKTFSSGGDAASLLECPSFPVEWKTVALPLNETFQPCIAAVSSPSLFYLFGPRQVDEQKHQEMMLQLAEYCSNQSVAQSSMAVPGKPVPGSACCARFTVDNNWYRAVVLEICDQGATVVYADYGNSEKVALSHILPIPTRLLQLPFQVIRCTLVDKDHFPAARLEEVEHMFKSVLQLGVVATAQSFDGFINVLSFSLPTERGGGNVTQMILDAIQAHSEMTSPVCLTPDNKVSVTNTKTATTDSSESKKPKRLDEKTTSEKVLPPEPAPQIPKPSKNTQSVNDDPGQRDIKQCTTDPGTRDLLPSSCCCCESLKNKIDHLEQLMQLQLSLIRKLTAQAE